MKALLLPILLASSLLHLPLSVNNQSSARNKCRWLFFTTDLTNPKSVDAMIARFPAAQAAGYNAIVCSANVAQEKATDLRMAAKKYGLDIIVTVMGGAHDRNYVEGVPVKDALFVSYAGAATSRPDNPTQV